MRRESCLLCEAKRCISVKDWKNCSHLSFLFLIKISRCNS